MGAVDLVVQIETPTSVASGMQRIGRASHQVEAVSRGVIFPKYRGDLLASAAITQAMKEGAVEETRVPQNPLDVLAQQLVAMVAVGERTVDELFALVRRAAPFADAAARAVRGRARHALRPLPSDEFAELRPRLVWDRLRGRVRAARGRAALVVANAGTIPDRGLYGVFLADGEGGGRRVGELDEEMVFESRAGEVFVLGASSWRIAEITRDRVLVVPAPGEPGKMPFWKADRGARPVELGRRIGRLTRELGARAARARRSSALAARARPRRARRAEPPRLPRRAARGDRRPARRPHDRARAHARRDGRLAAVPALALGRARPRALGDGARGEAARSGGGRGRDRSGATTASSSACPSASGRPRPASCCPSPRRSRTSWCASWAARSLFAARFREAAARALLLPRRRPGQRTPLWMQRKRAHDLLQVASRHAVVPDRARDLPRVPAGRLRPAGPVDLARRVRQPRDPAGHRRHPDALALRGLAALRLRRQLPLRRRRAARRAARPGALGRPGAAARAARRVGAARAARPRACSAELELQLQGLAGPARPTSPDRLHDLLLRLGDLSLDEIAARIDARRPATARPRPGSGSTRCARAAGDRRARSPARSGFAAAEDAGRLRDALGVAPPAGPAARPSSSSGAARSRRRSSRATPARTAPSPRRSSRVATAWAKPSILAALDELGARGRVLEGEFRPGRQRPRVVRARRARDAAPPLARRAAQAGRARGAGGARPHARRLAGRRARAPADRGPGTRRSDALLERGRAAAGRGAAGLDPGAGRAAGAAAGLPPRAPRRRSARPGEVVWVGLGALGERDGRLALYLADDLPLLAAGAAAEPPSGAVHDALREHLERHGASFFGELLEAAGGGLAAPVVDALWDLAWAGELTSDTPAALRALPRRACGARRAAAARLEPSARGGRCRRRRPAAGACVPLPQARCRAPRSAPARSPDSSWHATASSPATPWSSRACRAASRRSIRC